MTSRSVGGQSYTLNYDAENRLVSVSGAATANFVYDCDGKQIKATVNGITAVYVGNHYEVKNSIVTKYYFAGTTRLAVRTDGTLSFLLGDHLGSSSVTTDANGEKTASALYKAFGETRYTLGNLNTDYKFTGQREEASLGIYFFNARWYDSSLGRFLSPDSIIPPGTQGYDRYAYTYNNPLRYNDPTGHCPWCVAALVGGLVSAGINYGMQVAANVYAGQDLSTAATNVDGKSIAISFVGGAIAGATMGAVNPVLANVLVSETLAAGVSGAIAGVAGGQAEALADASISQISDMTSGESFDSTEFMQDASDAGFLNGGNMLEDAVIGGTLSAAGQKILSPIVGPARRIKNPMFFDDIYYQSKGYATGFVQGLVDASSDVLQEASSQIIDEADDSWFGDY